MNYSMYWILLYPTINLKAYRSIFTDVLQIWKQSQEVHGAKAHRPWIPFWIRTWLHR